MREMNQSFLMSNPVSQILDFLSYIKKPEIIFAAIIIMLLRCIWVGKTSKQFICWPVLGMLPSFALVPEIRVHDVLTDILRNNNGMFTFKGPWFCNFDYVFTSDPCDFEYIQKTNFSNFCKGETTRVITNDLIGINGYFSADGDEWMSQRKLASVKFRIPGYHKMVTESWVEFIRTRLFPITDDFVKQSVVFDLEDVLARLSFDQSCVVAFGVDLGTLKQDFPSVQYARAFKIAQNVTGMRFYFPVTIWKLMNYLNLGWERNMRRSIEQVNEFVHEVITSRKKELSEDKKPRFDALSILIQSKDGEENRHSENFLRNICLNFLFAGSDTVLVSLSWFFWLLHQNLAVEEKIYAEICSIGGKTSCGEEDKVVVFKEEEINKMNYLHACLTESLRLYPPVPVNLREVQNEDHLPNGLKLKKGAKVVTSAYAMGRMESVWGKDCREFKPERWLKNGKFVAGWQYKFPAFNAGLRTCLSKDLAYIQMKVAAASIIYRYRIHVVKNHPVVPKVSTVFLMKHGLKVTLTRRSDESEP